MNHLQETQRAALLKSLESAPDEVLLDAVSRQKEIFIGMEDDWRDIAKFIGAGPPRVEGAPKPAAKAEEPAPAVFKNVNPGRSAIGKIGQTTKDTLIGMLNAGTQPAAKMNEHMKLLWARNEVTYDGKEWGLP